MTNPRDQYIKDYAEAKKQPTKGGVRLGIVIAITHRDGKIPTGPCQVHDLRYGDRNIENGWFCDAHGYHLGSGYWTGRCPHGRIADWLQRRFDYNVEHYNDQ